MGLAFGTQHMLVDGIETMGQETDRPRFHYAALFMKRGAFYSRRAAATPFPMPRPRTQQRRRAKRPPASHRAARELLAVLTIIIIRRRRQRAPLVRPAAFIARRLPNGPSVRDAGHSLITSQRVALASMILMF